MKPHEIERHQAQANHLEIVLHLRADLFWFRGHFAVQPLLPGVAQIDWAMSYALTLLAPGWRFLPGELRSRQAVRQPDYPVAVAWRHRCRHPLQYRAD